MCTYLTDKARSPVPGVGAQLANWPFSLDTYMPDLEYGKDIRNALEYFRSTLLSDDTSVGSITTGVNGTSVDEYVLDEDQLALTLQANREHPRPYEFYFINRFLVKNIQSPLPADANKLRISYHAFRMLISHFQIAPAFVSTLSRYFLPCGSGSRYITSVSRCATRDFWYFLPVRVQVACPGDQIHVSIAGPNKMNPFYYLHLPDAKVDIRGSQIAIFFRHDYKHKSTAVVAVNLLDGRWSQVVEEPQMRIKEALNTHRVDVTKEPFFVHLVYLTSVARWWNNTLSSFNEQLIAHETKLQEEMESTAITSNDFYGEINKALHAMAAHLHRYRSELGSLEDTIEDISMHHKEFHECDDRTHSDQSRIALGFSQVKSQVKSVNSFSKELENKIQNILALLFNQIQLANDRMLVENGLQMQKILAVSQQEATYSRQIAEATQQEAANSRHVAMQSQNLAVEMKKDSVAMKTIAILTMFFLPGTSFAVYSHPLFSAS
ncbi:hypothetical protein BDD12DRAFT_28619 [Trichophaea hybrida]|nr:hypothetical protein BDD12DRAFT_28619 [Trichophaea hybrida]